MKLLVISDTHGRLDNPMFILNKIGPKMDHVIHLGDYDTDAITLSKQFPQLPFHFVQGNNDHSDTPYEKLVSIAGRRILCTHGHRQRVYWGLDRLHYLAQEQGAEVVLFGHTHIPLVEYAGSTLFVNPGSLTYPRSSSFPSFAILDLPQSGQITASIMELSPKNSIRKI